MATETPQTLRSRKDLEDFTQEELVEALNEYHRSFMAGLAEGTYSKKDLIEEIATLRAYNFVRRGKRP